MTTKEKSSTDAILCACASDTSYKMEIKASFLPVTNWELPLCQRALGVGGVAVEEGGAGRAAIASLSRHRVLKPGRAVS